LEEVDADTLCHKILGFEDLDNNEETDEMQEDTQPL
jgi:hypothetical protein